MPDTDDYRVTITDVRELLEAQGSHATNLDLITDEQVVDLGIDPANLEVTDKLGDTGQSSERLEAIERYLAGHFILTSGIDEVRQSVSASSGAGSASFTGDYARSDYGSTSLGQNALNLDRSGKLARGDWGSVFFRSM